MRLPQLDKLLLMKLILLIVLTKTTDLNTQLKQTPKKCSGKTHKMVISIFQITIFRTFNGVVLNGNFPSVY